MFDQVGKRLQEQLCDLGATSVLPVGYVDENVSESKYGGKEADFAAWSQVFWARILEGKLPQCDEDKEDDKNRKKKSCGSGGTCCSEKKQKVAENGEVRFNENNT